MKNKRTHFNDGSFLLFDSKNMGVTDHKNLAHFAFTDALIQYSGVNNQAIIHFWQTDPLVILGMMDTKIGHFDKGLKVFDQYEHDYMIRNSGGLAVVSDPGVLNLSLIYPSKKDQRFSIDEGYEYMLDFIRQTFYPHFPTEKIEAFEVKHSYCFGDYDLSINGQKIAGISQRRIKDGVAIMLYISINGNQKKRTQMLKEFYERGLDGSEAKGRYPDIKTEVMTTMEDAYQSELSVPEVKKMMLKHFDWSKGKYNKKIKASFDQALEKMYQRNIRFLGEAYVQKKLS
ncbi:MAG: lipoate--protein ligase family protein [Atopostipes suicloacalis]|nr:lipoate--protein ligase family protein [Atopostipes suicloacalis]